MASPLAACVRTSLSYVSRLLPTCPMSARFLALHKDPKAQERLCARAQAGRPVALKILFHLALAADRPDLLRLLFVEGQTLYAFSQVMSYGHFVAYDAVACLQTFSGYHLNLPFSPEDAMYTRAQHLFHTSWCAGSNLDATLLVLCYKGTTDMPTALLELYASSGTTLVFELLRSLGAVWTRKAIINLHLDSREDLLVALECGMSEALEGYNDSRLWDTVLCSAIELM